MANYWHKPKLQPIDVALKARELASELAQDHTYNVHGDHWKDIAINYLDDLHDDMQAFAKEMEE